MNRLKPTYELKNPKSENPTLIMFYMRIAGERIRRSVGRQIKPNDWDLVEHRPFKNKDLSRYLDSIDYEIDNVIRDCRRERRVVSPEDINDSLDIFLQTVRRKKDSPEVSKQNMFTQWATIVDMMRRGEILTPDKNKTKYEPLTLKQYDKWHGILETFFDDKEIPKSFQVVNMPVYDKFLSWCHDQDYSNNTIGSAIKIWKRVSSLARGFGWHTNIIPETKEFAKLQEETPAVYLNTVKLEKLYKVKLHNEMEDLARDWFVLDWFLGLRVSDLLRVGDEDFDGNFFRFTNKKTGHIITIPIHPYLKAIFKKYGGVPPYISDMDLNTYIKTAAKKAGLTGKFIYTVTKGGKLQSTTYQEWEVISSHTCRRSFITNLLRAGVPPHQVMKLAGIKRWETLKRYEKQSADEVAQDVSTHTFFTQLGKAAVDE